jgi:hypothetical protein
MAMVREQDLFIAVAPALDWTWSAVQARRRGRLHGPTAAASVAAAAVAFLAVYGLQLWAYVVLNGAPRPSTLVARKMNWLAPHGLSVLVSPRHGWIFWTPLVVIALAGLVWQLRTRSTDLLDRASPDRRIIIGLLAAIALQVYVAGSVESWTVAGAFGQRRFVALTAALMVGVAAAWAHMRSRRRRWAFATVLGAAVWWNLGLMAQFGSGLMDRQRLDPGTNAYHTFVTVPARLPELAYRYLFARTTFFKAKDAPP